jgi:hypothetical protein
MLASMAPFCEFGEMVTSSGSDNLAVHEDDWPRWNLVRAKKVARRVIEDGLILKGERECASVDLGKRVRVHELEEGRSRICAKDVNFVASALIEPGLQCKSTKGRCRGGLRLFAG